MAAEGVVQAEVAPHLPEAGIDVDEDSQRHRVQQLFVLQVTAEVQEQIGVAHAMRDFVPVQAGDCDPGLAVEH